MKLRCKLYPSTVESVHIISYRTPTKLSTKTKTRRAPLFSCHHGLTVWVWPVLTVSVTHGYTVWQYGAVRYRTVKEKKKNFRTLSFSRQGPINAVMHVESLSTVMYWARSFTVLYRKIRGKTVPGCTVHCLYCVYCIHCTELRDRQT